ncbi:hypothetical protein L596_010240 [Steinernema carpocapsae]|uniref:Uncharacterized protein n=1 Tax=Steinernema carpocapsae TaxID=34508 RepID=A0A4U5PJ23_STECR|nr:hypothetical protein L596_010240 [Steinernema carpocapsae]
MVSVFTFKPANSSNVVCPLPTGSGHTQRSKTRHLENTLGTARGHQEPQLPELAKISNKRSPFVMVVALVSEASQRIDRFEAVVVVVSVRSSAPSAIRNALFVYRLGVVARESSLSRHPEPMTKADPDSRRSLQTSSFPRITKRRKHVYFLLLETTELQRSSTNLAQRLRFRLREASQRLLEKGSEEKTLFTSRVGAAVARNEAIWLLDECAIAGQLVATDTGTSEWKLFLLQRQRRGEEDFGVFFRLWLDVLLDHSLINLSRITVASKAKNLFFKLNPQPFPCPKTTSKNNL